MNGQQIRNAVTTARQLAVHKEEKIDFKHLNHVIKVAQKFEKASCVHRLQFPYRTLPRGRQNA
jgi:hypothetical protein